MSQSSMSQGQDAFLDIVANLVGILIILIVIVGASASHAAKEFVTVDPEVESQIQQASYEADRQAYALKKVNSDNESLEQMIDQEQEIARQLTDIRHQRLVELETVRRAIDKQTLQLAEGDRQRLEQDAGQRKLKQKLDSLNASINAVQHLQTGVEQKTEVIRHYPNPIAKTVFAQEIHFCLSEGKLIWVPMDELVEMMKQHWQLVADNKAFQETRQTIGPIENYRLQYDLYSTGTGRNRRVQFRQFSLIPVSRRAGEDVAEALSNPRSDWAKRLSDTPPAATTVSIWVYPDSYVQHAQVKQWLHENGFKMASWPLDHGRPISGAPDGFRTTAQ